MTVAEYQKKCLAEYKKSIHYPEDYKFYYGNPIDVVVPVDTPVKGAMVVGPHPSAKFYNLDGIPDVPLYNNGVPFPNEEYFDGLRKTTVRSGGELKDFILKRVGVKSKDCWITYLVKVFLFKKGHVERYVQLGKTEIHENKSKFADYAARSIEWLEMEIEMAKPYVVILIGPEVASSVLGISEEQAMVLINGMAYRHTVGAHEVNVISLPHPNMLIRRSKQNEWPEKFQNVIAPTAKKEIQRLKKLVKRETLGITHDIEHSESPTEI